MARLPRPPLAALARPLTPRERGGLERALVALLDWQRDLAKWPRRAPAPDATPIVSVYTDGVLRGCAGSTEGEPAERLVRAFLLAESDLRFGGIPPAARARLVAQVAYPCRLQRVPLAEVARRIAPGAHGLALALPNGPPALLLPDVAREHELDAEGFLQALEHKSGLGRDAWPDTLFTFETETVTARLVAPPRRSRRKPVVPRRPADPLAAAVGWLSARVGRDGRVAFGLDPRTGESSAEGPMFHGRAAVVLQALALHPCGEAAAARVRRWLSREIERALAGHLVDGWPPEVPLVAGTLALAQLGGVSCEKPLSELARHPELPGMPWHAAQVVCALGAAAPDELYAACVDAAEHEPLAPWTVMAARVRGDRATFARTARALAALVVSVGPYAGGLGMHAWPEIALTAVLVEALSGAPDRSLAAARTRAVHVIGRLQHLEHVPPDVRDPELAFGAFPLTPVHAYLRTDVTAHAALALAAGAAPRSF